MIHQKSPKIHGSVDSGLPSPPLERKAGYHFLSDRDWRSRRRSDGDFLLLLLLLLLLLFPLLGKISLGYLGYPSPVLWCKSGELLKLYERSNGYVVGFKDILVLYKKIQYLLVDLPVFRSRLVDDVLDLRELLQV